MLKKNFMMMTFVLLFIFTLSEVFACTTFVLNDKTNLLFGRNYDFDAGDGHIIINRRNMIKTAFSLTGEKQVSWVSKYGSVTFNQIGKEFPMGGMNEAGLVIELMWLDDTVYPAMDERFSLMEVQWIQYQLDNHATVKEVAASSASIRISDQSYSLIHFLIADRKGNTAVLECLNGKMKVLQGKRLPVEALTNNTYRHSLKFLNSDRHDDCSLQNPCPQVDESLIRFKIAAVMLNEYEREEHNALDYSFEILQKVRIPDHTQWSIVYDLKNMIIYYKTNANPAIRTLAYSSTDFSEQAPDVYIDIDHQPGDKFVKNSYQANRTLLESICNQVIFLSYLPPAFRDMISAYPDSVKPVY